MEEALDGGAGRDGVREGGDGVIVVVGANEGDGEGSIAGAGAASEEEETEKRCDQRNMTTSPATLTATSSSMLRHMAWSAISMLSWWKAEVKAERGVAIMRRHGHVGVDVGGWVGGGHSCEGRQSEGGHGRSWGRLVQGARAGGARRAPERGRSGPGLGLGLE